MSKVALTNLANLQNETTAINTINGNNTNLITALNNTLSRDGTAPNQMLSTLDMNSNRIINTVSPISVTEPVSLGYLNSILAGNPIFSGLITGVPVSPFMQPVVNSANAVTAQGLLGIRTVLTADANYYVATTGSDSNNGTNIATPFLTIQKAIDIVWKTIDLAGFNVTINVANGGYGGNVVIDGRAVGQTGNSTITILGNVSTPTSVVIATTGAAFLIKNGAKVTISGVQVQTSGSGNCFDTQYGSHLTLSSFGFGDSAQYHISTGYNSITDITSTTYFIGGDAVAHYYTVLGSELLSISNTINLINGTRTFATAFLIGAVNSYSHVVGCTFTGSAVGRRFYMYMNAVYSDGGVNPYTFLPGNQEGTTFGGAVYNNDYEYNAWTNWNPTVPSVSGTSATAAGQYKVFGKDLFFTVDVTITVIGSSSIVSIPFPTASGQFAPYTLTPSRHTRAYSAVDTTTGGTLMSAYSTAGQSVINLQSTTGLFQGHTYTITGVVELT